MKLKPYLQSIIALGLYTAAANGAQTFVSTFSRPAYPEGLLVYNESGVRSPWFAAPPTKVTTNLMVDLDSMTARYSGTSTASTVTLSYTTGTYTQSTGSNPLASGSATISITMFMPAASFDTGVQEMGWNGGSYAFSHGILATLEGTLAVTMSVTSEDQTTTITENLGFTAQFQTSGLLEMDDYPNSASTTFHVLGNPWPWAGHVAHATAPNGFSASFTIIPEPSLPTLCAFSGLGLVARRKRRH